MISQKVFFTSIRIAFSIVDWYDLYESVDSQTSERSGTIMMVPFPSESRGRKVPYPAPLGRNRTAKAVQGSGLALGYDTFHF
ncbi:MAG: hypothetical protein KAQ69_13705, partial [Spirochaetales bacterium]|nr:hypothetical protein [Spirochaetales bacterium]